MASMSIIESEKSNRSLWSDGFGSTTTSTSGGACRSSRSNRWLREMAKARTATSSGDRILRSISAPDTLQT